MGRGCERLVGYARSQRTPSKALRADLDGHGRAQREPTQVANNQMHDLIRIFSERGDLAHLALFLWARPAPRASALFALRELSPAMRRFDDFVRELARFNDTFAIQHDSRRQVMDNLHSVIRNIKGETKARAAITSRCSASSSASSTASASGRGGVARAGSSAGEVASPPSPMTLPAGPSTAKASRPSYKNS